MPHKKIVRKTKFSGWFVFQNVSFSPHPNIRVSGSILLQNKYQLCCCITKFSHIPNDSKSRFIVCIYSMLPPVTCSVTNIYINPLSAKLFSQSHTLFKHYFFTLLPFSVSKFSINMAYQSAPSRKLSIWAKDVACMSSRTLSCCIFFLKHLIHILISLMALWQLRRKKKHILICNGISYL